MSSAAVRDVARRWPGRESQITSLRSWLSGRVGSHIIVHGPPGTGKTGVVRHCLEAWGHRFAYMTLPQEYKLRQLFNAVLSQLWGHTGLKRKRDGGFGATAGADSWNEFAEAVAAVCPPSSARCSVLVLDSMEWGAHKNLLPQLLAAIRCHRASLVVVAITATAPQDLRFGPGVGLALPLMHCLHFPAYNRDQLVEALAVNPPQSCGPSAAPSAALAGPSSSPSASASSSPAPSPELYASFLSAYVVSPLSPLTRSAADLAAVAAWLWPVYCRPLREGKVRWDAPVESQVRQLDGPMKQRDVVRRLLEVYRPGMRSAPPGLLAAHSGPLRGAASALTATGSGGSGGGGGGVDGECGGAGGGALVANLGKAAKLLLLAAFVASRNKPTLDKELFDYRTKPGAGRRRNGRGAGRAGEAGQEADRQAEVAKEARLKGPHAFPLTRLISIFHRLWAAAPSLGDELYGNLYGGSLFRTGTAASGDPDLMDVDLATGFAGGRNGLEAVWSQSAAVLSSVTGLRSMGLLAKHGPGDDPLDQPRFTCAIDEALALRLAADVRLTLQNYLLYDR